MAERPKSLLFLSAAMALTASTLGGAARALSQQANAGQISGTKGTSGGVRSYRRGRGPGWNAAHVKRMKRSRRNQLRAKGQFRQAVR